MTLPVIQLSIRRRYNGAEGVVERNRSHVLRWISVEAGTRFVFSWRWTWLPMANKRKSLSAILSVDTRSPPYQLYLLAIAVVPAAGLVAVNFKTVPGTYVLVGALRISPLPFVLLILNRHARWIGARYRNSMLAKGVPPRHVDLSYRAKMARDPTKTLHQ